MAAPRRKKPNQPTQPAGQKGPKKKRPPAAKKPPRAAAATSRAPELDLRTLVRLSVGDWSELADLQWPPDNIRRWLEKANVREVRGLLLTTLHRWHELRRGNGPDH